MRLFVLSFLLFITSIGHAQLVSTTIQKSNTVKSESYVIGVGNSGTTTFDNVLNYLQSRETINVYGICRSHKIIEFKALNSEYKSYDVIRDELQHEFKKLVLLRKTDTIFTKDCIGEILKQ